MARTLRSDDRKFVREVPGRRGPYTIDVQRHGVEIRRKGRRTTYTVSWDSIFSVGAKQRAAIACAKQVEHGRAS